jgi:hypothetical protein
MKNMLKTLKLKFILLLFAVVLGGLLAGGGIAIAASFYQGLNVGWNYISNTQSDPPHWTYSVDAWEWVNSSKTMVGFDSIHYYNGQGASNPYIPKFQETLVYDGYYNDVVTYWNFNGWLIQDINRTCDPSPDFIMDNISSSNPYALVQQYVEYGPSRTSDYVVTWVSY